MSLSARDRLGPYEILAPIGRGGMGEVFRARDTKLKRDVALKVLPESFAADPGRMARFQREAEVLASLNHPNIAHIYGVEERALVMELVEGESPKGPLPFDETWKIMTQIADALEYAHERGVVHRDLKPANVKVTPDGVVKLLDFGLAKAFSDQPDAGSADPSNSPTVTLGATVAGTIMGTAAYMAPEQARGKRVDKRADIWAWGVMLYELLTGARPFNGEDVTEILASVVKDQPDLSQVPAEVRPLLRSCLEKDPKKRLRDIGDSWRLLEQVAEPGRSSPKIRWVTPAVAVAMTLAASLLGWIAWRATRPVEHPLMQLNVEPVADTALMPGPGGPVSLSPDGQLLATVIRGADGRRHLATRRLDQSQFTIFPRPGGLSPRFSPDGRWIAYISPGGLEKIPAQGGAAVTLCNACRGPFSWGDDGNLVLSTSVATGLSRVSSEGGAVTPLTQLDPRKREWAHRWPQVLPGSREVLFTAYNTALNYDDSDIDVVSVKTGERKTVYRGGFDARYLPSGHLVFIHQNTLFAAPFDLKRLTLAGTPQPVVENVRNQTDEGGNFDFSQSGTFIYLNGKEQSQRSIFWLDSAGRTQPLESTPGLYSRPKFSPDGKRLAFYREDGQGHTDIFVKDLEHDTTSRLTALPGRNVDQLWTRPDGKAMIFAATNPAAPGLYSIRSDGSGEPHRLTDFNNRFAPWDISPDGKWLASIQADGERGVHILMAPIEGESNNPTLGKAVPYVSTPYTTIAPQFSPDGRWVAYSSSEPGKTGIWVRPFPGPGGQWQVDSNGNFPIWSRSGHELFYLSGGRIMVAEYSANGMSFVPGKPRVWSEHRLLDLGSPPVITYDVAPDGKRFAVILYGDGTAEEKPVTHVTFLLNFFDYLRQRVPLPK